MSERTIGVLICCFIVAHPPYKRDERLFFLSTTSPLVFPPSVLRFLTRGSKLTLDESLHATGPMFRMIIFDFLIYFLASCFNLIFQLVALRNR